MKKKSIIKLSITAVILIALGCWINSRWNASVIPQKQFTVP